MKPVKHHCQYKVNEIRCRLYLHSRPDNHRCTSPYRTQQNNGLVDQLPDLIHSMATNCTL